MAERGGDQVVADEGSDRVDVPGRVLVDDFTAVLRRNDFVALIGPNGAGKSSFISTILGDRAAASGEVKIGASITAAWFRQDLSATSLCGRRCIGASRISGRRGIAARCRIVLVRLGSAATKSTRDRHVERRGAGARCARTHDTRESQSPHPRRADKPPRRREHRSARRRAGGLRWLRCCW